MEERDGSDGPSVAGRYAVRRRCLHDHRVQVVDPQHVVDDLRYDVVANLGDQYSDLIGGYADRTVKLPNPTYYLP